MSNFTDYGTAVAVRHAFFRLCKSGFLVRLRQAYICTRKSTARQELQFDIAKEFENQDINSDLFTVEVNITPVSTTDPEIIEVHYKSLFPESNYVKPIVRLEVSGRSMNEPLRKIDLQSLVDKEFPNASRYYYFRVAAGL